RLKRALTTSVVAEAAQTADPNTLVDTWRERREAALARYAQLLGELRAAGGTSLSMLLVVVREMAALERH
ncbi:MAG TPA: NAD-glutamate dehydrogenase, partial [Paraburkholderia sp.]